MYGHTLQEALMDAVDLHVEETYQWRSSDSLPRTPPTSPEIESLLSACLTSYDKTFDTVSRMSLPNDHMLPMTSQPNFPRRPRPRKVQRFGNCDNNHQITTLHKKSWYGRTKHRKAVDHGSVTDRHSRYKRHDVLKESYRSRLMNRMRWVLRHRHWSL
jgi:hypothetical protein